MTEGMNGLGFLGQTQQYKRQKITKKKTYQLKQHNWIINNHKNKSYSRIFHEYTQINNIISSEVRTSNSQNIRR